MRRRIPPDESGEVGIGILLAVTLTFVVSVSITFAFVNLYGQAAMRSAIDEGIRAGTRIGGDQVAVCEVAAQQVLDSLVPGKLGDDISPPSCSLGADGFLVATISADFPTPIPGLSRWHVALSGSGTREVGP